MAAQSSTSAEAALGVLTRNWGWLLIMGILFVILGLIGLGRVFVLTVAGTLFFGILMIIGGLAQFLEAFKLGGWKGTVFHVVMAILYVAGGIFVIVDPTAAKLMLTWVLGVVFLSVGIIRVIMALQMRPMGSWLMPFLGGIISMVLGGIILAQWPFSGLYFIGLFIAIELIVNGWSYIFIALAARKANKRLAA